MLPILYTAELDLAESDVDLFMNWFAFRHVPDLQASGFPACACYRATEGGMKLLDLYELPGLDVFRRPRYVEMGKRDSYAGAVLSMRQDKSNTVYDQRMIGGSRAGSDLPIDADWMSLIRFDAPDASAAAFEKLLQDDAKRLTGLGALTIRYAKRGQDHPTHGTHRPRYLALVEWSKSPVENASLLVLLDKVGASDFSNIKPFAGYRVYPWPDDASLRK